jgi:hypothetical protein
MRCMPTNFLMAVALMASGSCLAQQAHGEVAVDAGATGNTQAAATAQAPATDTASPRPRSAFGKVMAIMISSLERQSRDERPAAPVHTSAAGTPLGIEVGEAFRAPSSSPSTPSPDYAVREPALAGPD